MEIITGYTGENHVTSADDASLYRGILGTGDYVLDVGNKFAATIIDNNTVRIMDGDLVIQGHQARIRANDYEEVTIDNGTPGQKRNDLIVARYQKNTITGIESISLAVVKGTPGPTAVDPETVQEDLKTGGTQRDFALYRVSLDGLVLESVTSLFSTIPNLKAFKTHLAESASKHIHSSGENWKRFDDGSAEVWGQYVCTGNIGGGGYALIGPTKSLPISFVDTPIATITLSNESNYANYTAGIRITPYLWALTQTTIAIRAYDPWNENLVEDDVVLINYIIKGRWK